MQLMIDILVETPATLRLAAQFLFDHATVVENSKPANVPAGTLTPPAPPVPPVPSNVLPFVPPPPVGAPVAASLAPSTASNLTAPTVPPVPTATSAASTSAPVPPVPPAPSMTPPNVSHATTTTGVIERDSAGMPWDERIHQKKKGKKKDLTWKLQKGIDPAIVSGVIADLQARGLMGTPATVGASAPVSLPGAGSSAHAPGAHGTGAAALVPPPPPGFTTEQAEALAAQAAYKATGAQVPPPPPFSQEGGQAQAMNFQSAVPVPPAPGMGMPDATNGGVVSDVDPYRALVAKFTKARAEGKITAEQVNSIVLQAGAPSLQTLKAMPHLIGAVDAYLDGAILTG